MACVTQGVATLISRSLVDWVLHLPKNFPGDIGWAAVLVCLRWLTHLGSAPLRAITGHLHGPNTMCERGRTFATAITAVR